jgi:hypothetical protein
MVRADLAKEFGLATSLLERLSKRPLYSRGEGGVYDHRVVTKLLRNYRSHPQILKLPNDFFYNSELIPCADKIRSHSLVDWEHLPTQGFPLIFHGVQGEDLREANSPSWFNVVEAEVVKNYVDLLVKETRRNRCEPRDIGVVTPYHKQAQKLRLLLNAFGYADVKVGSVDEFQGQERRVIIISTVRSSKEYIDFDLRHNLGFVSNPKRFNVAVTRAQALLIVVGDPFVLADDPHWGAMLQFARENGGYVGCEYMPTTASPSDVDRLDNAFRGLSVEQGAEGAVHEDVEVIADIFVEGVTEAAGRTQEVAAVGSSLPSSEAAAASTDAEAEQGADRYLTLFHGTGLAAARLILADGIRPSKQGPLGPGCYLARRENAERFAWGDHRRELGPPALVECLVAYRRPKSIAGADPKGLWRADGFDACHTAASPPSPSMEWCFLDADQVMPRRIHELLIPPRAVAGEGSRGAATGEAIEFDLPAVSQMAAQEGAAWRSEE